MAPVQLVYAALVFEYVDVDRTLSNLRDVCLPGGMIAALLQPPKDGAASVSPSPFTTLKRPDSILRLVPPDDLRTAATNLDLGLASGRLVTLASGKTFALQVFRCGDRDA